MTNCLFLLGRFIKGLPVNSAVLPEELEKAIGLETMSNGISYVLSTKVHRNTDEKIICSLCSVFLLLHQNLDFNGFCLFCAFISNCISNFSGFCVAMSSSFQNYIRLHIDRKAICLKGGSANSSLTKINLPNPSKTLLIRTLSHCSQSAWISAF